MTQQPVYPGYPPQGYPQPDPAQQFMQPQAPAPQQYAPPTYAGQPYAPPQYAPPAPQAPPLAQGTIDDFYNQPSSGGGPSLKFEQPGTRYVGVVARAIGPGDVQQQTDTQNRPLFFKDGRPKFVMKIPLQMQPSPAYPDGTAQWYVKGAARDELVRAMAEAGAPPGAPEQGAVLDITFTGTRNSGPGMNPAKLFRVVYAGPNGAGAPSPAPAPEVAPPAQQQPVQQQVPAQVPQGQPLQAPPGLSAEQQELLAKLTGGQGQPAPAQA